MTPVTPINQYKCTKCEGKSFKHRQSLHNHVQRAHMDKEFPCTKCNATFKSNYVLKRHLNQKKPCNASNKDHSCTICNLVCSSKYNLGRHIQRSHTPSAKKKVFDCKQCDESLPSLAALRAHKKLHTTKVKIWKRSAKKKQKEAPSEMDQQELMDYELATGEITLATDYMYGDDDDLELVTMAQTKQVG